MERLTEVENGTAMVKGCGSNCKYGFEYCRKEDWENCKTIDDVIDKLAEYEDLEEQGRLIKLPCKVGDTLYRLVPNLYIAPQLVWWLEELNSYRAHIFSGDMTQAMLKEQYCKAIDDFVIIIKERVGMDWDWDFMFIEQIAEQLKAGANDGTDSQ